MNERDEHTRESDPPAMVLTASYLYFLASVVVLLNDKGIAWGPDGLALVGPDTWQVGVLQLGLLAVGGIALLGALRRTRWGLPATAAVFGTWAAFVWALGRPLVAGGIGLGVVYLFSATD